MTALKKKPKKPAAMIDEKTAAVNFQAGIDGRGTGWTGGNCIAQSGYGDQSRYSIASAYSAFRHQGCGRLCGSCADSGTGRRQGLCFCSGSTGGHSARENLDLNGWVGLVLKCGEINLRTMELLDAGNTGSLWPSRAHQSAAGR